MLYGPWVMGKKSLKGLNTEGVKGEHEPNNGFRPLALKMDEIFL